MMKCMSNEIFHDFLKNTFDFVTSSYEIQEEGPVQQISYVSDKECGYLRIVSEDDLIDTRFVGKLRHGVPLNWFM